MTPEERELVVDLFRRLAELEREPRDPDAERLMREGLQRAPNGVYALVQTVLLQDEALKAADDRIAQLEDELKQAQSGGQQRGERSFLGERREGRWNTGEVLRGSVPPIRPGDQPMGAPSGFGGDRGYEQPMAAGPGAGYGSPMAAEPSRGGSFLGTAAAAAAGAIGGGLLMSGIRSAMGGGQGGGPFSGAFDQLSGGKSGGGGMPWNRGGAGEMSREAGLDDIGGGGRRYGAADVSKASYAKGGSEDDTEEGEFEDDFEGGFEDDTDTA